MRAIRQRIEVRSVGVEDCLGGGGDFLTQRRREVGKRRARVRGVGVEDCLGGDGDFLTQRRREAEDAEA